MYSLPGGIQKKFPLIQHNSVAKRCVGDERPAVAVELAVVEPAGNVAFVAGNTVEAFVASAAAVARTVDDGLEHHNSGTVIHNYH